MHPIYSLNHSLIPYQEPGGLREVWVLEASGLGFRVSGFGFRV